MPQLPRAALACLLALGSQGAGFAVSNYLTTFLSTERGLSLSVAGMLSRGDLIAAYNHADHLAERAAMMQSWAAWLDSIAAAHQDRKS